MLIPLSQAAPAFRPQPCQAQNFRLKRDRQRTMLCGRGIKHVAEATACCPNIEDNDEDLPCNGITNMSHRVESQE